MNPPTQQEIYQAYDRMTEDDPNKPFEYGLVTAAANNPIITGFIRTLNIDREQRKFPCTDAMGTALIWGLHLGMHIVEARCKEKP